jgi:phage terminase small subunit
MPKRRVTKVLTPQMERFCEEYLVDLNALQAAIRAGYSKRSAASTGSELMGRVQVQERIQKLKDERAKRTAITADRVINELATIGFAKVKDYLTWDGKKLTIKKFEDLTPEQQSVISEMSESVNVAGINHKIKFHDKLRALELIGKHLGLFKDQIEVSGKDGAPVPVQIYLPDNGRGRSS